MSAPTTTKIGLFPLICMTTALFLTLRNMPAMAQTGTQMLFFNVIAVFAFLIPAALVSAELGTGWPESGVFGWVEAAFGIRPALVASWLQWAQSVFGLTSILAYASGTAAYVLNPQLGNSPLFVGASIIGIYWGATFINFFGAKGSSTISTVCLVGGVITPAIVLVVAGAAWLVTGQHSDLDLADPWIPSLGNTTTLLLFLSFIFGFVGIEVSAASIKDVDNPQKMYPKALFTAAVAGFVVTLAGAAAIAIIVPMNKIDTINGAIQALSIAFDHAHLHWLVGVLAVLIAVGATGQVSTWIVGPVKGLAVAGKKGYLPSKLLDNNRHGVPTRLLVAQASIVTLIGAVFIVSPSVNSTFLILTSVAVVLYCIMYVLMFAAAIYLRVMKPHVPRAYVVPGGLVGMIVVASLGLVTVAACFVIGFIPPTPNPLHSGVFYGVALGVVCAAVTSVAVFARRRWRDSTTVQVV